MPKRIRPACIHCRQMKLRCDSNVRFPAPCSRCAKSMVNCSVNPLFKRTAKRDRLEALELEMQEMKKKLEEIPGEQGVNLPGAVHSSGGEGVSDSYNTSPSAQSTWTRNEPNFESKILGTVEISPLTISELIEEYYMNYHPRFPILPDRERFSQNYFSCPLLFWTVIWIASKESPKFPHLYLPMVPALKALANDIGQKSLAISTVQSFLLLCVWPFPFNETYEDLSWAYCGLATHLGLQLGLHRPNYISEFAGDCHVDRMTQLERRRTWIACFLLNVNISTRVGVPATIKADSSIIAVLESNLDDEGVIEQALKVAYISYKFTDILGNHEYSPSGLLPNSLDVVRMFDAELGSLESKHSQNWTFPIHISFLGAKLCLYSLALSSYDPSDGKRRAGIYIPLAFTTALQLLERASEATLEVPYWTTHTRTCVLIATFFLMKITDGVSDDRVDKVASRDAISRAWTLFNSCSIVENDNMSRVCAVIEYLSNSNIATQQSGNEISLAVKSRLAANLAFDTIWRARKRFKQTAQDANQVWRLDKSKALDQSANLLPGWDTSIDDIIANWDMEFSGL